MKINTAAREAANKIQLKMEDYAKAALPGLLSSLDVHSITLGYAEKVATAAFAIGLAMVEKEREIIAKTEESMKLKGY